MWVRVPPEPLNTMKQFWKLEPAIFDDGYIPDAQEIAEMEQLEQVQKECKHLNYSDEDGCLDCGFDSK